MSSGFDIFTSTCAWNLFLFDTCICWCFFVFMIFFLLWTKQWDQLVLRDACIILYFNLFHFLCLISFIFSLIAVRSRTLLQVQEEYTEELPDSTQFKLNSSDYLKAASPLPSQNMPSLREVTLEVSEIERKSQENKIKTQKR